MDWTKMPWTKTGRTHKDYLGHITWIIIEQPCQRSLPHLSLQKAKSYTCAVLLVREYIYGNHQQRNRHFSKSIYRQVICAWKSREISRKKIVLIMPGKFHEKLFFFHQKLIIYGNVEFVFLEQFKSNYLYFFLSFFNKCRRLLRYWSIFDKSSLKMWS